MQSLVPSPLPPREQVSGVNDPLPLEAKLTDPSGSVAVPTPASSDTVTVQLVLVTASMVAGRQATLVVVGRPWTV
jgi:hypothetical protein